ncbi:DUF4258 domain-containing protein [Methanospirillum purgamenti]|nr:DUF4258 domain-containing protein [Methanospirillum hungatei]
MQQMITWNISRKDGLDILHSGEIIESYPEDLPYPSYLIVGYSHRRPLHVVMSCAKEICTIYIVTAYEPDKLKWDENFRRRI